MNVYENMRCVMEDNAHLISMVPVEELLRFGYEVGLKPGILILTFDRQIPILRVGSSVW